MFETNDYFQQKQSMDVTAEEIPASGDGYVAQLPSHASTPEKEHESKSKESHDKKEVNTATFIRIMLILLNTDIKPVRFPGSSEGTQRGS